MKTTAPAALRVAPPDSGPTRSHDPADSGLGPALIGAFQEHRRRLGLAGRAYAVRRAWTLGFLASIMTDPTGLRLGQVLAALEGTGYGLELARLPAAPLPGIGTAGRSRPRPEEHSSTLIEPVIRLPPAECLCEADDACRRRA